MTGSQGFKAGLALEAHVSQQLTQLGIPHRCTSHYGREDMHDKVELIVHPPGGRKPLEVQITLRAKALSKILRFAFKALTTRARGIRLYLEVVGSHRKGDLAQVGRKVAQAIALIMRSFRNFGPANLLGVRIHALNAKIEKFDVVELCGEPLRKLVEAWREREAQRRAQQPPTPPPVRQEREAPPKPPPFWVGLQKLADIFRPPRPRLEPPFDSRPFFMPRRLC